MNILFKIRAGIKFNNVAATLHSNKDNKEYNIYETYNPKYFVMKHDKDYRLLTRLPSGKWLQIASSEATWNERVINYLKRQRDAEAKELLKGKD